MTVDSRVDSTSTVDGGELTLESIVDHTSLFVTTEYASSTRSGDPLAALNIASWKAERAEPGPGSRAP